MNRHVFRKIHPFFNILLSIPTYYSHGCGNFYGKQILILERDCIALDDDSLRRTEIHKMVLDVGEEWGKSYGPGQFVMVRSKEGNERVPLTITKFSEGKMTLVFQVLGASTWKLSQLEAGDHIEDLTYPLGKPLLIEPPFRGKEIAVVVAGGVGIAPAFAKTDALHREGFDVRMILSSRNWELLILLEEMYASIGLNFGDENDKIMISTDDGSYDGHNYVTFGDTVEDRKMFGVEVLDQIIDYEGKVEPEKKLGFGGKESGGLYNMLNAKNIKEVFAVGPLPMMRSIAQATEKMNIPTYASLNTVMVDGTGMCGGCRVTVGKEDFYVCADGPTTNVSGMNWDGMADRGDAYDQLETLSSKLLQFEKPVGDISISEYLKKEGLDEELQRSDYLMRLVDKFDMENQVKIGELMDKMKYQFRHVAGYLSLQEAVQVQAIMCTCKYNDKTKMCQKRCPVNIDIQAFVRFLKAEEMKEALSAKFDVSTDSKLLELIEAVENNPEENAEAVEIVDKQIYGAFSVIKESNPIPEITGLVCPQELQCQEKCISKFRKKIGPTPIGKLESFVAHWIRIHKDRIVGYDWYQTPEISPPTGKKVMVVGSGPAGLVCSAELAKKGHDVTVYETLHNAGGVLVYGIPEFRLPKEIVQYEVVEISSLGVNFEMNRKISDLVKHMEDNDFDAAFVGTGAGCPTYLSIDGELIPGQDLVGVFSANEFLTRTNLMKSYLFPVSDTPPADVVGKNVVVFGGGNVAMDSARCALRLGAKKVTVMYRRTGDEIPAREEEYEHAKEEGIYFEYLSSPLELLGDKDGHIVGVKYQKNELGDKDDRGRRSPVPIPGDIHTYEADVCVIAVGQGANTIMDMSPFELVRGRIIVDESTMRTNLENVFAGGDIIEPHSDKEGGTVIYAAGCGLIASQTIDQILKE